MSPRRQQQAVTTVADGGGAFDETRTPDAAMDVALETFRAIPKEQLYEKISSALIEQISVGMLVPGQRLPMGDGEIVGPPEVGALVVQVRNPAIGRRPRPGLGSRRTRV